MIAAVCNMNDSNKALFQQVAGRTVADATCDKTVCVRDLHEDKILPEAVKPVGAWFNLAQRRYKTDEGVWTPTSEIVVEGQSGLIAEWLYAWSETAPQYYLLDLTLKNFVAACDLARPAICPDFEKLGNVTFSIHSFTDDDETYKKLKKHLHVKLEHAYQWKKQSRTAHIQRLCGHNQRAMDKLADLERRGLIKKL